MSENKTVVIRAVASILLPSAGTSADIAPGSVIEVSEPEAKKLIDAGAAVEALGAKPSTTDELQNRRDDRSKAQRKMEADRIAAIKAANS